MALQGAIPVEFGNVFTHGAFAAGGFEPMRDFDASSGDRFVQAKDKQSGQPVWVIEVIDADPAARDKTAKVKVAAPAQPVLPAAPIRRSPAPSTRTSRPSRTTTTTAQRARLPRWANGTLMARKTDNCLTVIEASNVIVP